jgi:hypothetical protein
MSRALFRGVVVLSLAGLVACGDQSDVEVKASALGVSGWPQGMDCGLGYYRNGVNVVDGVCQGFRTGNANIDWCDQSAMGRCDVAGSCAPGFGVGPDGDRGLCAPWGFYHQHLLSSTGGVTLTNTDQLFLPKGTACGFKDNCNDPALTCMGFNPAVSCPPGWVKKVGSDSNAPASCNGGPGGFVWCEYQDPNNLCTGTCQLQDQPAGIVCGIDDNDRHNGQCLGQSTDSACPPGWARKTWFDDGRSVGHGIGWCTKI